MTAEVAETVRSAKAGDGKHPYDYYRGPDDALRPAPSRFQRTPTYDHVRKFMLGDLRDVVTDTLPTAPGDYRERYEDQLWEGDQLMDAYVAAFPRLRNPGGRALFDRAVKDGIDSIENPPEELVALFEQLETEPDWLDWEQLEKGARIFSNIPFFYKLLNGLVDLTFTTNSASVSLATGATGRFQRQKENRFIESMTLFTTMCSPGGMRRDGPGFATCVHIRMMHAFVRRAMFKREGLFDFDTHGNPISSGDSVPAGPLFGVGVCLVLRAYGTRMPKEEMEAVDMLFRYMVYLMGGHPNAIAEDFEEGLFSIDYFFATLGEPSRFSEEMNRTLFCEMIESIKSRSGSRWGKAKVEFVYSHVLSAFLWDMFGDRLCKEIGYIPKPTVLTRYIPHAFRAFSRRFSPERSYDLPYNEEYATDALVQQLKGLFNATDEEAEVSFRAHDNTTGDSLRSTA